MGKTICFLLSGALCNPVGGHKIVYQYANALAILGHRVLIVNNIFRPSSHSWQVESIRKAYSFLRNIYRKVLHQNTCSRWFNLVPGVNEIQVWTYDVKYMPPADYYVATNALTAPFLLAYRVPDLNKFYFIQGYETWLVGERELIKSFHFPFRKVVVAGWLKKKLNLLAEDAVYIPNGYDQSRFSLTIPVKDKIRCRISILYHEMPEKNFAMGLEVISMVKLRCPGLQVSVFGVYPRPSFIPDWCEYYQSPSAGLHNKINNEASIYLGTSSTEGLSLTIIEAMACGQAVVCTDIDGYTEVAEHNSTALISPAGDANRMAENVLKLIEDDDLRIRIATKAYEKMANFSMANSMRLFTGLFV